jgi:hypothetical protein
MKCELGAVRALLYPAGISQTKLWALPFPPTPPTPRSPPISFFSSSFCGPISGQEFKTDLVWAPDAVEALRCASEDYLTQLFQDAQDAAIHGRRSAVRPSDMQHVRGIRGQEFKG